MKISFLYYKNLLDLACIEFFRVCNDLFAKQPDGTYLFSSGASRLKLKKFFKVAIEHKIKALAKPWSIEDPSCLVVIGSCFPRDNILLDFRDKSEYFPKKVLRVLEVKPTLKWILREKDVKVDISILNELFLELFNEILEQKSAKHIGDFKNVMLVSHKKLDCYSIFKILKWKYGKTATSNLYVEEGLDTKCLPLVALNDLLSKYIHNKARISKMGEFKQCASELLQYASDWMS